MSWSCISQQASEGEPSGHDYMDGSEYDTTKRLLVEVTQPFSPQTRDMNYGSWYDIVAMYNDCRLSYPTDKLSALSGLAKHFQDLTKDEYMA
jgi:hypothetical protein